MTITTATITLTVVAMLASSGGGAVVQAPPPDTKQSCMDRNLDVLPDRTRHLLCDSPRLRNLDREVYQTLWELGEAIREVDDGWSADMYDTALVLLHRERARCRTVVCLITLYNGVLPEYRSLRDRYQDQARELSAARTRRPT